MEGKKGYLTEQFVQVFRTSSGCRSSGRDDVVVVEDIICLLYFGLQEIASVCNSFIRPPI